MVEVQNLSKKYLTGETEVEALRGITFKANRGDVIGVFGSNGCGKSTLIKILSGLLAPSEGRVILKGAVASLSGIGAGFHPDLTGKENFFLKGQIHGLTRNALRQLYAEVVSFSGLEEWMDRPLRSYSGGMYMRLAFSTSIHLKAEIMLFDEILAVGDVAFRMKCYEKIIEISPNTTILIVTHSLSELRELCNRFLIMDKGHIKDDTRDLNNVVNYAHQLRKPQLSTRQSVWIVPNRLKCASLTFNGKSDTHTLEIESPINLVLIFEVTDILSSEMQIILIVKNKLDNPVFSVSTMSNNALEKLNGTRFSLATSIPANFLNTGTYSISIGALIDNDFHRQDFLESFQLIENSNVEFNTYRGDVRLNQHFELSTES